MSVTFSLSTKGGAVNGDLQQVFDDLGLPPETQAMAKALGSKTKIKFGLFVFRVDLPIEPNAVYKVELPCLIKDFHKQSPFLQALIRDKIRQTLHQALYTYVHHCFSLVVESLPDGDLKDTYGEWLTNNTKMTALMGWLVKPGLALDLYDLPIKSWLNVAAELAGSADDIAKGLSAEPQPPEQFNVPPTKIVFEDLDSGEEELPTKTKKKVKFSTQVTPKEKMAAKQAFQEVELEIDQPMPVNAVIGLAEAKAVGQKVRGTSANSVYRCFAVGPVNLACRINNSAVSVRAEPPFGKVFDPQVLTNLSKLGFTDKGKYMSLHAVTDTPEKRNRFLGALLFSLGVTFKSVATNMEALNG